MFDWTLVEENAGEQLWAAKVAGGLLLKFVTIFKVSPSISITFIPGSKLTTKKDGTKSIVKGK